MRIEQHIAASWADKISRTVVDEVCGLLKQMKVELSGNSGLRNAWEEVCAQVQGQESTDWNMYDDTLNDLIESAVRSLGLDEQLALWTATDAGWNFAYDHHADQNGAEEAPFNITDVVTKQKDAVLSAAANYDSATLYHFLWGKENPQYEDVDEGEEEDQ